MSEMFIDPYMSLQIANLGEDPYSHESLADNWLRLSQHDHSEGKGVQIPTAGIRKEAITTEKIAKGAVGNEQLSSEVTSIPTGSVLPYGGTSAPANWLLANGQEVNRTTYANLFGVIGTTFGSGNGTTTFNVPDLRNRFPIGAESTYSRGSKGGSTTASLPSTTYSFLGGGSEHNFVTPQTINVINPYIALNFIIKT